MNTTIEFCIFELDKSLYQTSLLTKDFRFLDQICPRKMFMVENGKSKHYHWIFHIQISLNLPEKGIFGQIEKKWTSSWNSAYWISLSTKFQLKLTILSFWTKFIQKGYFQWKQNNQPNAIKVFTFFFLIQQLFLNIFKISKILVFWTLWKKLVISWHLGSFYFNPSGHISTFTIWFESRDKLLMVAS